MVQTKDYLGTVYGGLGQLLYTYSQEKNLNISGKLEKIQNVERFDFTIWREVLDEINDQVQSPALGLEIAEYVQPKHLGIIGYIAQSSDTLGEALARYHDFHRLVYDGSPLSIESRGDNLLSVRWETLPAHLTTQITDEIAIALTVQFLKQFLDLDDIHLNQVNFLKAVPKNMSFYEHYFQTKVKFNQPNVEMIFPLEFLSLPIKHADLTLQKILLQQAEALLDKLPNTTRLDERLQQCILLGLQKNNYQIEDIAEQLRTSVRQLQRHLQDQKTTFQQRVQEIRHLMAIKYLEDPHLSLQEISLLLSYSEQSAFQRAFKLWTGLTPRQWRQNRINKREVNFYDQTLS